MHFFKPLSHSLVLFDQVLDGLVCVFYFLLASLYLLGPRPVAVDPPSRGLPQLLLLETLLVHLVNEHVYVLTHFLQLVPQLLVLRLQKLLFLRIVT